MRADRLGKSSIAHCPIKSCKSKQTKEKVYWRHSLRFLRNLFSFITFSLVANPGSVNKSDSRIYFISIMERVISESKMFDQSISRNIIMQKSLPLALVLKRTHIFPSHNLVSFIQNNSNYADNPRIIFKHTNIVLKKRERIKNRSSGRWCWTHFKNLLIM